MKKILTFLTAALFITHNLYFITPAQAAIFNPVINNGQNQVSNPQAYTNSVLGAVISIFFIVAVIYFVWHIVFAGYHLIASEGDPKKWETAKNEMVWAFVGVLVVFVVFALLKFVGTVLGITGLEGLTIAWPTL